MFAPTDRTHPEHKRRLSKATCPPTGPAPESAPHAAGWLARDRDTDAVGLPVDGTEAGAREADAESQAEMLARAAHRRRCHVNGHLTRPVCDDCKATWCEGCREGKSCRAVQRSTAARTEARRLSKLDDGSDERADAAARAARAAAALAQSLPCTALRCPSCPPVRPCRVCGPSRCPECREQAGKPTGAQKLALHRQASAILRGAGLDPRTAAPDADARAHAVGELRALLTDLRDVARTVAALAPVLMP